MFSDGVESLQTTVFFFHVALLESICDSHWCSTNSRAGAGCCAGSTHFGDNVEDEWLIVACMLNITTQLAGTVATVRDSDGEFMLIEAADVRASRNTRV